MAKAKKGPTGKMLKGTTGRAAAHDDCCCCDDCICGCCAATEDPGSATLSLSGVTACGSPWAPACSIPSSDDVTFEALGGYGICNVDVYGQTCGSGWLERWKAWYWGGECDVGVPEGITTGGFVTLEKSLYEPQLIFTGRNMSDEPCDGGTVILSSDLGSGDCGGGHYFGRVRGYGGTMIVSFT